MEDLRILEQQQRESQRNLAAIKVVKQHKIEQRSSLDGKLFSLKFSNGEARFQLNHSRQVLSNSQRDLASAKLRSERSNDNLKKFDTKLKKAFESLRGLHLKRRKMEEMMVLLGNLFSNLDAKEKDMNHKTKQLELDLEDAKYRETLLIKSIQSAKVKKQELVDETGKMRSELSILENDLTNVQQIEIQTKIRLEQRRSDIENEKCRFDEVRTSFEKRIKEAEITKSELERKIQALKIDSDESAQLLDVEWKKCVEIQKIEGHKISASSQDAYLNVSAIRDNLDNHKVTLATRQKEKISVEDRIRLLEAELMDIEKKNSLMQTEQDKILTEIERGSEIETKRRSDIESFKNQVAKQRKTTEELTAILESFKKEKLSIENDFKVKKEHIHSKFMSEKEKLIALTLEFDELHGKNSELDKELAQEKSISTVKITAAKQDAEKSNEALKEIQSRFEKLDQPEQICKEEEEEIRMISEISSQQQSLLTEYPCLASIDLSSDPYHSKEEHINLAVSTLRASCEAKLDAIRRNYEERLENLEQLQHQARKTCRIVEKTSKGAHDNLERKKNGSHHDQLKETPKGKDRSDLSSRNSKIGNGCTELPVQSANDLINQGRVLSKGRSKRNFCENSSKSEAEGSPILRSSKRNRSSYGTTSSERKRETKRNESSNTEETKTSTSVLKKSSSSLYAFQDKRKPPEPVVSNKSVIFPPKRAEKVRFHASTYDAENLKNKKKRSEIVSIPGHVETSENLQSHSRSNNLSSSLNGRTGKDVEPYTNSQKSVLKLRHENERVHSRNSNVHSLKDVQKDRSVSMRSYTKSSWKETPSISNIIAKDRCLPSKTSQHSQSSDEKQKRNHKPSISSFHESQSQNALSKSIVKDRPKLSKTKDYSTSSSSIKGTTKDSQSSKARSKLEHSIRDDIKKKSSVRPSSVVTNSRRRKKSVSTTRKSGTEPNSIGDFSFLDE
jgi:hypothetical protein